MRVFITLCGCFMLMSMRRVIAALVVVGLAIGVFLLWPRSEPNETDDTVAAATTTTSTSIAETTTTDAPVTSTTADDGSHVVETVEEAEEILRELWFGWFEGIYNQDEERIREVVVLEETVETARENFGVMEFSEPPRIELIHLENLEILRSDESCLAIWAGLDVSDFRPEALGTNGVYVLRSTSHGWELLSVWSNRADLWEEDCESEL